MIRNWINLLVENDQKTPAQRVVDDFYEVKLPFGVWVDVSARYDDHDTVKLNNISTTQRGEGQGSRALDLLCRIADAHQVAIELEVGGSSDDEESGDALSGDDLVDWYHRRGFDWVSGRAIMRREPIEA